MHRSGSGTCEQANVTLLIDVLRRSTRSNIQRSCKVYPHMCEGGSSETRILGRSGELQVGCESPSSFLQITQRFSTRFTACLPARIQNRSLRAVSVLSTELCFTVWWVHESAIRPWDGFGHQDWILCFNL